MILLFITRLLSLVDVLSFHSSVVVNLFPLTVIRALWWFPVWLWFYIRPSRVWIEETGVGANPVDIADIGAGVFGEL